ncbi:MAG: LamG domain-containing protein [Planctomycetota bacterium]|jgi:hypothetical protein
MCKKAISLISLVLVLALAGSVSAELVGQWKLDDGAGTTAMDATGNGNDGTLEDDPTVVDGQFGQALAFESSRVVIPASDTLTADLFQGSFTLSAWINPRRTGNTWQQIFRAVAASGSNDTLFLNNDGRLSWRGRVGGGWAGGMCETAADVVPADQWTHVAVTGDETNFRIYVNGALSQESAFQTTDGANENYYIGGTAGGESYSGMVDDLRVYNHVLSEDDVRASMENQGGAIVKAYGPDPKNRAMLEATWVTLTWRAGDLAVSQDVYMGDNFDDVNNGSADTFQGNQVSTMFIVGFPGFPFPEGLVPGTTYYWRTDGVNPDDPNSPWKGDVWSFWIPPKTAWQPAPADGARYVAPDAELSWTAGFGGKLHTVYFGDDFDTVANATGGVAQGTTTFSPGELALGTTYYWRVDEFDPPFTHKGDVWSFTTLPVVSITDPDLIGWWTFDEGGGDTALDWSGHSNHGTVAGDPEWVDGIMKGALDLSSDYVAIDGVVDDITSTNITLSIWINSTQTNQGDMIAANDTGSGHPLEFYIESGRPGRYDGSDTTYTNAPVVADGQWHMMTYVRDGAVGRIYVDGVQVASDPATFDLAAIARWSIGQEWDSGPSNFYMGMVDDVRFYNKALTAEEIAVVMRGDTKLAASPVPGPSAVVDIRDISSLSWSAGDTAASHDVYFGQDRDSVADADNNTPEFQGNQTGTSLSLASLVEFGAGDYYWRVDEVEADGTINTGTIWKFTVPDYLIVEDFESYNDIDEGEPGSNRIYLTWIDGFGTTDNGSQAGNLNPPFMSQGRSSAQAMPLSYNNAGKTSEVTRTLVSKKDWTEHGVTKLVLWFSGDSGNAPDRMFVALGNAIVYHPRMGDRPAGICQSGCGPCQCSFNNHWFRDKECPGSHRRHRNGALRRYPVDSLSCKRLCGW